MLKWQALFKNVHIELDWLVRWSISSLTENLVIFVIDELFKPFQSKNAKNIPVPASQNMGKCAIFYDSKLNIFEFFIVGETTWAFFKLFSFLKINILHCFLTNLQTNDRADNQQISQQWERWVQPCTTRMYLLMKHSGVSSLSTEDLCAASKCRDVVWHGTNEYWHHIQAHQGLSSQKWQN